MGIFFSVFGIIFVVYGVMAFKNPKSIMPKIKKGSGKKEEIYQVEYNPLVVKLMAFAFILFGCLFTLLSIASSIPF